MRWCYGSHRLFLTPKNLYHCFATISNAVVAWLHLFEWFVFDKWCCPPNATGSIIFAKATNQSIVAVACVHLHLPPLQLNREWLGMGEMFCNPPKHTTIQVLLHFLQLPAKPIVNCDVLKCRYFLNMNWGAIQNDEALKLEINGTATHYSMHNALH